MRLKVRDLVAMLLVAAIAVPYVGYLIDGDVPLVQDARGMAAVGLLLGAAAFAVLVGGNKRDRVGKIETGLAALSAVLGLIALALAETAAAEVLLAIFMVSILVVLAAELIDHAGWWHAGHPV
jgi:multisubunit Na+/H+ antiporter MnhF subunit